jgi:hypothetical protein
MNSYAGSSEILMGDTLLSGSCMREACLTFGSEVPKGRNILAQGEAKVSFTNFAAALGKRFRSPIGRATDDDFGLSVTEAEIHHGVRQISSSVPPDGTRCDFLGRCWGIRTYPGRRQLSLKTVLAIARIFLPWAFIFRPFRTFDGTPSAFLVGLKA